MKESELINKAFKIINFSSMIWWHVVCQKFMKISEKYNAFICSVEVSQREKVVTFGIVFLRN